METESNRKEPSTRRRRGVKRRHLPPGSGPYTVGTVDVMYEHSEEGAFFRLYYPTSNTDIFVSYLIADSVLSGGFDLMGKIANSVT